MNEHNFKFDEIKNVKSGAQWFLQVMFHFGFDFSILLTSDYNEKKHLPNYKSIKSDIFKTKTRIFTSRKITHSEFFKSPQFKVGSKFSTCTKRTLHEFIF